MYDPNLVQPMRDEMTRAGFTEATTPEAVDAALNSGAQTVLMFVNSVCGCSAGVARPGIAAALNHPLRPATCITAFGGNDKEAVARMRDHFIGYPPSSPCAGLFRDGELVFMLERHQIEGNSADNVTKLIQSAFERYCGPEMDLSKELWDPNTAYILDVSKLDNLKAQGEVVFLDLREENERAGHEIAGALPVTNELANEIVATWPKDKTIVVLCQRGQRSLPAVQYLRGQGFEQAWSLRGGASALV